MRQREYIGSVQQAIDDRGMLALHVALFGAAACPTDRACAGCFTRFGSSVERMVYGDAYLRGIEPKPRGVLR